MRPFLLRFASACGLALLLQLPVGFVGAAAITPDAATRYIADMGDRAVQVLATQGSASIRQEEFARLMLEAIDFDAIAMATLGRMARTVSEHDRREFTELFAARLIDVAIERFGNIRMQRFVADDARPQPNGDVKVHTLIDREGDEKLSVDWRVRLTEAGPRINDIEVAGYSLVIHYRGEFERANVSSVPGLINKLKDLNKSSVALVTVRREMK